MKEPFYQNIEVRVDYVKGEVTEEVSARGWITLYRRMIGTAEVNLLQKNSCYGRETIVVWIYVE